jgi:hypothetical protein
MNEPKKLTSQQRAEEQQATTHQEQTQSQGRELNFNSVEEMLRHDALQTPVPPGIECRLQESIDRTPRNKSWWRRWFGS